MISIHAIPVSGSNEWGKILSKNLLNQTDHRSFIIEYTIQMKVNTRIKEKVGRFNNDATKKR